LSESCEIHRVDEIRMITIHLTPDDLVNMRFAYRPLLELAFSYRVFANPSLQAPHRRWVEEARHALHDMAFPYLEALVTPSGRFIPHFLTPTPLTNSVDVENDLAELLATPDALVQKYVGQLIEEEGDSEMRRYFMAHPHEALECLVEELRFYWQRALARHGSRMLSIKEGDILYRARILALNGTGSLFSDLHPSFAYKAGRIEIQRSAPSCKDQSEFRLDGRGLQLVPAVFASECRMQMASEWRPRLSYPVRGAGLWWQKPPSQSLELALGTGRASVLQALVIPASTGELAHRLMLTSGAVSQHLDRLKQAGLVEAHRSGRRVYYHLTRRGEELIALFERTL
jgi:hypothetical protein